jgi:hypothetical protein
MVMNAVRDGQWVRYQTGGGQTASSQAMNAAARMSGRMRP